MLPLPSTREAAEAAAMRPPAPRAPCSPGPSSGPEGSAAGGGSACAGASQSGLGRQLGTRTAFGTRSVQTQPSQSGVHLVTVGNLIIANDINVALMQIEEK